MMAVSDGGVSLPEVNTEPAAAAYRCVTYSLHACMCPATIKMREPEGGCGVGMPERASGMRDRGMVRHDRANSARKCRLRDRMAGLDPFVGFPYVRARLRAQPNQRVYSVPSVPFQASRHPNQVLAPWLFARSERAVRPGRVSSAASRRRRTCWPTGWSSDCSDAFPQRDLWPGATSRAGGCSGHARNLPCDTAARAAVSQPTGCQRHGESRAPLSVHLLRRGPSTPLTAENRGGVAPYIRFDTGTCATSFA